MRKLHSGFTLIELVIILVILGILAAVAIPRYVDLTNEAEAATCNGIKGALLSTAGILIADPAVGGGIGSPGSLSDIVDNTSKDGWTATSDTTACTITATVTSTGNDCPVINVPSDLNSDC